MTKSNYVLGIDTSNYTTSVALLDLDGRLVADARILLPVKAEDVGLRQSDALFQHIKNLPILFDEVKAKIEGNIVAIAAATSPRPVEGSYMPVFMASKSFGQALSSLMGLPFFEFSHQEGHIDAGLWSLNTAFDEEFLALHISGGTTELLRVIPHKLGYKIEIVGGTGDISAGQFIDRIGVKLGLPFPAGPTLDALAVGWQGEAVKIPVSVKGTQISFSGPETFLQRRAEEFQSKEELAYSLFNCIGHSLVGILKNQYKLKEFRHLLVVGGVAANNQIRSIIQGDLSINTSFAVSRYCSDNAVGIAVLGLKKILGRNPWGR